MKPVRHRLLALLIAAVAALFAAAPASAQEATATATPTATPRIDNSAIAINTEDNSTVFEFAFDFRRVLNGIVDQTNVAIAYASCTNCTTIAIAIQIVLVAGTASSVT